MFVYKMNFKQAKKLFNDNEKVYVKTKEEESFHISGLDECNQVQLSKNSVGRIIGIKDYVEAVFDFGRIDNDYLGPTKIIDLLPKDLDYFKENEIPVEKRKSIDDYLNKKSRKHKNLF